MQNVSRLFSTLAQIFLWSLTMSLFDVDKEAENIRLRQGIISNLDQFLASKHVILAALAVIIYRNPLVSYH